MLGFIKERYKDFQVILKDNEYAKIINPYGKGNITVYYHPESEWADFSVIWDIYRDYVDSKDDIIKNLDAFVYEKEVHIKFYKYGELCMCATLNAALLENLTLDKLSCALRTYTELLNTTFTICSFSGKYDMHGRIEKAYGKYTLICE